ncbi:glutaminyl-tRNA synthase (glutamine-hydrolysing) [Synchytrium microbalum]|uniref:Glutaminyl-tRNA synthase (Glutamine-hydrolysing) n=1 Tax=Synchytrium microbalum TaxID=1806994 RepID=A0A507C5C3_9FUNG|nr:glutaminyl-tRNA synthase (glutamine-hydrolysing) [Synchytrium microbalum]TPX36187.1 glutaminyl-tRNA synthase (glutamine-hydrolysing) [Synchytrium microbalum]
MAPPTGKTLSIKKKSSSSSLLARKQTSQHTFVPPARDLRRPTKLSRNLPFPTATIDEVLNASASEIVHRITIARQWNAEMVMMAFASRALEVHQTTNAITQHFIDRAISRARDLDHEFRRTGIAKGPLHGVPFVVDEHIDIEGTDSTMGFSQFVGNPAPKSALIVLALERAGAIPFAKCNVPQSMASFDTSNPLYGVTTHPLNRGLSPGGSSGGIAALICADGAPIGVGTDIGGSNRIPAHFCGIYCLKPSGGRFPLEGVRDNIPGQDAVKMVVGPMARYLDDLQIISKLLVEERPWNADPRTLPMIWDDQPVEPKAKLRFGYYIDDGFVRATPPCARAVAETLMALEAQGYECVRFDPPDVPQALRLALALLVADGLATLVGPKGRDPMDSHLAGLSKLINMPKWVKAVAVRGLVARHENEAASMLAATDPVDVKRLWQLQRGQAEYQARFHDARAPFDAILAPAHVHPATPLDSSGEMSWAGSYSLLYSFLDYSAGVLPVTNVFADVDILTESHDRKYNLLERRAYKFYDPERENGMPIGVQVITGRYQEEKTLAVMSIVQQALKDFRTQMLNEPATPTRLAASNAEMSLKTIAEVTEARYAKEQRESSNKEKMVVRRRSLTERLSGSLKLSKTDAAALRASGSESAANHDFEREVAQAGLTGPIEFKEIPSPTNSFAVSPVSVLSPTPVKLSPTLVTLSPAPVTESPTPVTESPLRMTASPLPETAQLAFDSVEIDQQAPDSPEFGEVNIRKSAESKRSFRFFSGRKSEDAKSIKQSEDTRSIKSTKSSKSILNRGFWRKSEDVPRSVMSNGKPKYWEQQIIKQRRRSVAKDISREEVEMRQSMEADRKAEEELKKRELSREAVEKAALKSLASRPRLSLDSKRPPQVSSETESFFGNSLDVTTLERKPSNGASAGLSRTGSHTLRKSLIAPKAEATQPADATSLISTLRDKQPKETPRPLMVDSSTSPVEFEAPLETAVVQPEALAVAVALLAPDASAVSNLVGPRRDSLTSTPEAAPLPTEDLEAFDEEDFDSKALERLNRLRSVSMDSIIHSSVDSGIGPSSDSAEDISENESVEWEKPQLSAKTLEILDEIEEEDSDEHNSSYEEDNVAVSSEESSDQEEAAGRASSDSNASAGPKGILKRISAYPIELELEHESSNDQRRSLVVDLASIPPPPPGQPPSKGILKNAGSFETERLRRIAAGTLRELKRQPTLGDLNIRLSSDDDTRDDITTTARMLTPRSAVPGSPLPLAALPKVSKSPTAAIMSPAWKSPTSPVRQSTSQQSTVPLLVHQSSDDDLPPARVSSLSATALQRYQAVVPLVIITKPAAPIVVVSPAGKKSIAVISPELVTPTSGSLVMSPLSAAKSPVSPKTHLDVPKRERILEEYRQSSVDRSNSGSDNDSLPPPPPPPATSDPKLAKELLKLWMDAMGVKMTSDLRQVLQSESSSSPATTTTTPASSGKDEDRSTSRTSMDAVSVTSAGTSTSRKSKPALKSIDTKVAAAPADKKVEQASPAATKKPKQRPVSAIEGNQGAPGSSPNLALKHSVSSELLTLYLEAKNIKRTPSIEALLAGGADDSESVRSSSRSHRRRSNGTRAPRAHSRDSTVSTSSSSQQVPRKQGILKSGNNSNPTSPTSPRPPVPPKDYDYNIRYDTMPVAQRKRLSRFSLRRYGR